MQATSFDETLDKILKSGTRYPRDAFVFIREALDHTQKIVCKGTKGLRHVTPKELLEGIREHALAEYGPMAMAVFEEWGIRSCRDFGELVFILVENGLLAKTDRDSREEFDKGYDFAEAFRAPFVPKARRNKPVVAAKAGRT